MRICLFQQCRVIVFLVPNILFVPGLSYMKNQYSRGLCISCSQLLDIMLQFGLPFLGVPMDSELFCSVSSLKYTVTTKTLVQLNQWESNQEYLRNNFNTFFLLFLALYNSLRLFNNVSYWLLCRFILIFTSYPVDNL